MLRTFQWIDPRWLLVAVLLLLGADLVRAATAKLRLRSMEEGDPGAWSNQNRHQPRRRIGFEVSH